MKIPDENLMQKTSIFQKGMPMMMTNPTGEYRPTESCRLLLTATMCLCVILKPEKNGSLAGMAAINKSMPAPMAGRI
jgi:hypothetical protein